MKKLLLMLGFLGFAVLTFAQDNESGNVIYDFLLPYVATTAAYSAAVIAATTFLQTSKLTKSIFENWKSQLVSFIPGTALGIAAHVFNVGIFAGNTILETGLEILGVTLLTNGAFDFLFKTLGGKKSKEIEEPIK